jgi:hypothetical protein
VVGRRGRVGAGWPTATAPWCDGSGRRSNGDAPRCGHVAGSGWRAEEERGQAWSKSQACGPEEEERRRKEERRKEREEGKRMKGKKERRKENRKKKGKRKREKGKKGK